MRERALRRDGCLCVVCLHKYKRISLADGGVHHVFGHGRDADDVREDYTNLMSLCHKCHLGKDELRPIKNMEHPPLDMMWVLELKEKINAVYAVDR